MRILMLMMFCLSVTQVSAQDINLGDLSVGDIQQMYETEAEKELTKISFQIFFNAYMVGYYRGLSYAAFIAGFDDESISSKFADCAPNSKRLFYEMLGVSDERIKLNLAQFAENAMRDSCRNAINLLVLNQKNEVNGK